ncbi:MAG: hypothetical protein IPH13_04850 [Planctomycetes bacterium]|nr:hypothetical protein [Planctomycetota bacterium]MCC7172549.1 hypothetical protein [Planctomycetota bacterium]
MQMEPSARRADPNGTQPTATDDASELRPLRRQILFGILLLCIPIAVSVVVRGRLPEFALYPHELFLLPLLASFRLIWALRTRRRLWPLVDLPLIGLLFVFTGADDSPLDPALFLVYVLVALYVERVPRRRYRSTYLVAFLAGVIGMYALVVAHVRLDQSAKLDLARDGIKRQMDLVRQGLEDRSVDAEAAHAVYEAVRTEISTWAEQDIILRQNTFLFAGTSGEAGLPQPVRTLAPFDIEYRRAENAIEERQRLLIEAGAAIHADLDAETASAIRERLGTQFEEQRAVISTSIERITTAVNELTTADESRAFYTAWVPRYVRALVLSDLAHPLENATTQQENVRAEIEAFVEAVYRADVIEQALPEDLQRLLTERLAMVLLVLAALSLVAALSTHYENEVARREATKTELEEREKENWIALTAGLTHTIGNDILAYDAYAQEAIDVLATRKDVAPEAVRNVRFILESNKARLAFIKFLDEFARARKAALDGDGVKPTGLAPVPIEPLLREVRARVGQVEIADLPRGSSDPMVNAQISRFAELGLEVEFAKADAECQRFSAGKRGILEFFVYELLKNALRNCSGSVPLRALVDKVEGRVKIAFVNDLEVREEKAADGSPRWRLPRIAGMKPCNDAELRDEVGSILAQCFEPGRGGGTGLGLFLIRYFAREYYRGSVTAAIHDWSKREVAFVLDLPDDLSR